MQSSGYFSEAMDFPKFSHSWHSVECKRLSCMRSQPHWLSSLRTMETTCFSCGSRVPFSLWTNANSTCLQRFLWNASAVHRWFISVDVNKLIFASLGVWLRTTPLWRELREQFRTFRVKLFLSEFNYPQIDVSSFQIDFCLKLERALITLQK